MVFMLTQSQFKNKKKEKKREVLEKNTIVNNINASVDVCLYFDNFL